MQLNGHRTCLQHQIGHNIFTREVKSSDMFLSHCTINGHIFVHDKRARAISNNMLKKRGSKVLHNPNWWYDIEATKFILAIKTQNRLCHSSCTFCQNDKLGLFTTFQKHCCLEDHQDLSGFFFFRCNMILLVSSKQCNSIFFVTLLHFYSFRHHKQPLLTLFFINIPI